MANAEAEHRLSMMTQAGVEANTISYNIVIQACAEAYDVATQKIIIINDSSPSGLLRL